MEEGRLLFLGTGGGRIASFKQFRATGGIWLEWGRTAVHIDPGPEALSRVLQKKLNPASLSAILLTHKHLDHCGDINVMIEAMTEGGKSVRGAVYAPSDALEGEDPVIFRYLRSYVQKIAVLNLHQPVSIPPFSFLPTAHYIHGGVETFRFLIQYDQKKIALFVDGKNLEGVEQAKGCDLAVIYSLLYHANPEIDHLSLKETREIIRQVRPRKTILTHYGMTMLRNHPWEIARALSEELECEIIAAWDNMTLDLLTLNVMHTERGKRKSGEENSN